MSEPSIAPVDNETLLQVHLDATAFYSWSLRRDTDEARDARDYLLGRAVRAKAIVGYQLGHAPARATALTAHLRRRGYLDEQLLAAGLTVPTASGRLIDRFRGRIVFPVHDARGVIGFLGRALPPPAGAGPKYVNSPTTALFRKRDILYGLHSPAAREALATGARPVLVEGPLDAIAVTAMGSGEFIGVAPSGTALRAEQVIVLDRIAGPLQHRGIVVAFDADDAGQRAALRVFPLLLAVGARPTVALLPSGQDPAGVAAIGDGRALRHALSHAATHLLADQVIDAALAPWTGRLAWAEGRVSAASSAAAKIAELPPDLVARQVARVAGWTGVGHREVTTRVLEAVTAGGPARSPGRASATNRR